MWHDCLKLKAKWTNEGSLFTCSSFFHFCILFDSLQMITTPTATAFLRTSLRLKKHTHNEGPSPHIHIDTIIWVNFGETSRFPQHFLLTLSQWLGSHSARPPNNCCVKTASYSELHRCYYDNTPARLGWMETIKAMPYYPEESYQQY